MNGKLSNHDMVSFFQNKQFISWEMKIEIRQFMFSLLK